MLFAIVSPRPEISARPTIVFERDDCTIPVQCDGLRVSFTLDVIEADNTAPSDTERTAFDRSKNDIPFNDALRVGLEATE